MPPLSAPPAKISSPSGKTPTPTSPPEASQGGVCAVGMNWFGLPSRQRFLVLTPKVPPESLQGFSLQERGYERREDKTRRQSPIRKRDLRERMADFDGAGAFWREARELYRHDFAGMIFPGTWERSLDHRQSAQSN